VSRGVVRGRARVALTLTEASEVQPDEILIVPVIDVGWTPSFATIGGFASEVGAALSHGAVVAREYGIPTVVNLRNATRTFHTGDLVELDADHGVLQRISEA
jgi:pyruvate,water dikinase